MGDPQGFVNFARELAPRRLPLERITGENRWDEFVLPWDEAALRQQGARCMDCGVPFCHTGIDYAAHRSGCPISNIIPDFNDAVYRAQWELALRRLSQTNEFPEFTGRVCPAPCEASCTVARIGRPVTIKQMERAIIDYAFAAGWIVPCPPASRTGKRVAIVGSGPAGLAAANQLNRVGHHVTVFERAARVGGLLILGIPNMKLDKSIVQRRIALMEAEGIEFRTNTEVGRDIAAEQLVADFDAVLLCIGSTVPNDLRADGRNVSGVHFAMEYLSQNTESLLASRHADGNFINARGKHVIVIGGGDTGTDCVGTALRHECESLIQFEITNRPPDHDDPNGANPQWPSWPTYLRTDYGQEEAAALFGADPRVFNISTTRVISSDGRVTGLDTQLVEWTPSGLKPIPDTERHYDADLVLLAMGFRGPEPTIIEELGLARDNRSNILAQFGDHRTSREKVFTAGDCRRGQSLVVWAISEGRKGAQAVDAFLRNGPSPLPG